MLTAAEVQKIIDDMVSLKQAPPPKGAKAAANAAANDAAAKKEARVSIFSLFSLDAEINAYEKKR